MGLGEIEWNVNTAKENYLIKNMKQKMAVSGAILNIIINSKK